MDKRRRRRRAKKKIPLTHWLASYAGDRQRAEQYQRVLQAHGLECYRRGDTLHGPGSQAVKAFATLGQNGDALSASAALVAAGAS